MLLDKLKSSAWMLAAIAGGVLRARGDAPVGQRVFVRGGLFKGDAPSLPIVVLEI